MELIITPFLESGLVLWFAFIDEYGKTALWVHCLDLRDLTFSVTFLECFSEPPYKDVGLEYWKGAHMWRKRGFPRSSASINDREVIHAILGLPVQPNLELYVVTYASPGKIGIEATKLMNKM